MALWLAKNKHQMRTVNMFDGPPVLDNIGLWRGTGPHGSRWLFALSASLADKFKLKPGDCVEVEINRKDK